MGAERGVSRPAKKSHARMQKSGVQKNGGLQLCCSAPRRVSSGFAGGFIQSFYQRIEDIFDHSSAVMFDFALGFHTGDQTEIFFNALEFAADGKSGAVILDRMTGDIVFQSIFRNVFHHTVESAVFLEWISCKFDPCFGTDFDFTLLL